MKKKALATLHCRVFFVSPGPAAPFFPITESFCVGTKKGIEVEEGDRHSAPGIRPLGLFESLAVVILILNK